MAASFIVISEDRMEYIMGGGIIPGEPEDSNSYRAELGEILGIHAIVESLRCGAPDNNASITFVCDNEKAI